MNTYNLTPAARIARYVKSILVIECGTVTGPFMLPLFANGTPTLLFSTVKGQVNGIAAHLTLFGQTMAPAQMLIPSDFKLVAYFLHPCAIGELFHLGAGELTDRPIGLALTDGNNGLQEHLLNATCMQQIIALIDDYLYNKIQRGKDEDKRMTYAVGRIGDDPHKHILSDLQHELNLTERTFQRIFERQIGVSPNQFRRISQFSKAFSQINTQSTPDLSAITYHNGYADQSHFIRSFREFTSLTPTDYLGLSRGIGH